MKLGFIGLGGMGMPMAQNLLKAGFQLTVHTRSRGKVEELAGQGASPATSPKEVTEGSQVILTCLPDVAAVEEVFLGQDGVVQSAAIGQVLIDLSTVGPATSRTITHAARTRGAAFLDAPVSGGVERATSGTLTIMVGGEEEAFQRARPIFEVLGSTVRHVGPSGAGSAVKLINQLLVGVHTVAAAEAVVMGAKAGVDPVQLLEILNASWGASFMLSRNGPVMLDRSFEHARAPLRLILKDLSLIDQWAQEIEAPLHLGEQALKIFQEAMHQGMSELDLSAAVLALERHAGLKLSPPEKRRCP